MQTKPQWWLGACSGWHLYNEILLSHLKRWNLAIFEYMDWPWEYYAKWNKSDGERQIP